AEEDPGMGEDLLGAEALGDPHARVAEALVLADRGALVRGREPLQGEAPDANPPEPRRERASSETTDASHRRQRYRSGAPSARPLVRDRHGRQPQVRVPVAKRFHEQPQPTTIEGD